ncbi:MBL fold metallo-hydrolase [Deinococcus sonorensis]|uniref:MBL fold metallo-hydrolase n=2 Tax=Deinococcus sonorensis TaxID=309891 RepID=A0AAU7U8Y3_9DEIO
MKLSDHVYALDLQATLSGGQTSIYPALILDDLQGATLVDTGMPGMQDLIETALREAGLGVKDLRQIIITHHDLDHIGSLAVLVAASGAQVMALEQEVPYLVGDLPSQKTPSPEMRQRMLDTASPALKAYLLDPPRIAVDRVLQDGEVLPMAGGVRVVATPGHTTGHLSLFVEQDDILITGDAMTSSGGELHGPMERATPDMPEAIRSVEKLSALPVRQILTYHGGLVRDEASAQLVKVSQALSAG